MTRPLAEFKALTFDCYGTLIDWESGILAVLRPWAQRASVDTDDAALLEAFARAEPAEQSAHPGVPYTEILRGVMGRIAGELGAEATAEDAEALARSVGDWPAFPDTVAALRVLARRAKIIIVSNVDKASFAGTLAKLGVTPDAVVTAEEVGAYKPDVRMFRRALDVVEGLGIDPAAHLHVAQSLHHDIVPAAALGIPTCWIDRRAGRPGGATPEPAGPVRPVYMFTTMAEFASAVSPDDPVTPAEPREEEPAVSTEAVFVPIPERHTPGGTPEAAARAFYEVMRKRRTVREFSHEPVSRETIEWVVRAATTAPSGANKQPWRFVCVQDAETKKKIRAAAEEEEREFYERRASQTWLADLAPLGTDTTKEFIEVAPWVIVVFKLAKGDDGSQVYYNTESVGLAAGLLLAAVHHAGLASVTHTPSPMGFLKEVLGRPANERPFLLLPVGYPAEGCTVPAEALKRKPLDEAMVVI